MTKLAPEKRSSIILLCSEDGLVEEVLLDNNNILRTVHLPKGIPYLFTQNSADKLAAFWLALKQNKTADDYQLYIASNGVDMLFSFSGFTLNGKILISGSSEVNDSKKILPGIMQIINEMQNEIRLLKKQVITLEKKNQVEDLGTNLMDDFSRINNELVNNQRELNRKHAEISKLMSNLEISRNNLEMFAYSVSHDLKEPARMVSSFMQMYSKKYGENIDSKGKQYIDFALDGSIRIQRMIDNLLVFYRSSAIEAMETVDLNVVMQEVQKLLNLQFTEKNVQLELGDLPVVKSAYSAMLQVFQNLINNAVKFTPPERQPQIKVSAEKQGKTWLFSIKDNGVGIAEDEMESVFKLFRQTGAFTKSSGSGLGLAIVQRIIENNGGEIWVESELGIGSIFKFTIPN